MIPDSASHIRFVTGCKVLPFWAKCRPRKAQNGESRSWWQILNREALSRSVSEIFACDTRTDRPTTRTVTIAVAGQLIIDHNVVKISPG